MRLTVLGGCGAWPEAGQACSGFLVEHDGFRLLVDLGYATVPRLLEVLPAEQAGPSPRIAELADGTALFVAEASYIDRVPEDSRRYLSSARQAGRAAARAGAGRLLLTHLMPGTDHAAARAAASAEYGGLVDVATPGLVLGLDEGSVSWRAGRRAPPTARTRRRSRSATGRSSTGLARPGRPGPARASCSPRR
jgi:ribonuclease BN (tRNA processing enzyme)